MFVRLSLTIKGYLLAYLQQSKSGVTHCRCWRLSFRVLAAAAAAAAVVISLAEFFRTGDFLRKF